jgi:hypothetical protein
VRWWAGTNSQCTPPGVFRGRRCRGFQHARLSAAPRVLDLRLLRLQQPGLQSHSRIPKRPQQQRILSLARVDLNSAPSPPQSRQSPLAARWPAVCPPAVRAAAHGVAQNQHDRRHHERAVQHHAVLRCAAGAAGEGGQVAQGQPVQGSRCLACSVCGHVGVRVAASMSASARAHTRAHSRVRLETSDSKRWLSPHLLCAAALLQGFRCAAAPACLPAARRHLFHVAALCRLGSETPTLAPALEPQSAARC